MKFLAANEAEPVKEGYEDKLKFLIAGLKVGMRATDTMRLGMSVEARMMDVMGGGGRVHIAAFRDGRCQHNALSGRVE